MALTPHGDNVASMAWGARNSNSAQVHGPAPLTHDSRGQRVRAKAPIEGTAPLFQRGGTVVPRQRRLRRSTVAMATDPYELTVALDSNGAAAGEVFLDDGVSFDFVRGGFARTAFSYANGKLSAAPAHECDARARTLGVEADAATGAFAPANVVERIVVLGLRRRRPGRRRPRRLLLLDGRGADDPPADLPMAGRPSTSLLSHLYKKQNYTEGGGARPGRIRRAAGRAI